MHHLKIMFELGSNSGDHFVSTSYRAAKVKEAMELVKISAEEGDDS